MRPANRRPREGKEGGRGRFPPRRRVCAFCADKSALIDYKDVARLRRFISERGRIETRRRTGTCSRHQRAMATALKRARHLALLPYTSFHIRDTGVISRALPQPSDAGPAPIQAPPQTGDNGGSVQASAETKDTDSPTPAS